MVLFARNVDLDAFPYHLARPCRAVAGVWKRGFENFQPTLDDTLDVGEVLKRNTRKELVGKFFSLVLSEAQKNHTENLEVVSVIHLPIGLFIMTCESCGILS